MRASSSVVAFTLLGLENLNRPVDPVIEPPGIHHFDVGGPEMQNSG